MYLIYDVVVGAPYYDPGLHNAGQAWVFYGPVAGLAALPAWTAAGTQADTDFGDAVAGAGDVNGDGYSDVIAGAPGYDINAELANAGAAYVFYGKAGGKLRCLYLPLVMRN